MTRFPGTRINRPEDELQRRQVGYLRVLQNQGRLRFAAVPNGGYRRKTEAAIMKGLGTAAGFPDLILLWGHASVAFIENKSADGRASDTQKDWAKWLTDNSHRYALIRSFDEFLKALHGWEIISSREAMGAVTIPHYGEVK
jgi:hypothetical protein